jgi:DNA-binding transcriptional MerR regulator
MKNLDIHTVAKRSGLPASTLRYYEERGLIRSIGRIGLRRIFDAGVLDRLALIALGRAAGFSLDEMTDMFAPDGKPRIDRRVLAAKAGEIDQTIRRLSAIREGLLHASVCRAPSHMECPTFQRILRVASSRKLAPAPRAVERATPRARR